MKIEVNDCFNCPFFDGYWSCCQIDKGPSDTTGTGGSPEDCPLNNESIEVNKVTKDV